MGLRDKLLTAGGVVLFSALARTLYEDAQEAQRVAEETSRRQNSPLFFDEGLTRSEFIDAAHDVAQRTPRVQDVVVTGMTVTLHVGSLSGLSTWTAEIDFNDYGHLTGQYWLKTENADSLIPEHYANQVQAQIQRRVTSTAPSSMPPPISGTGFNSCLQYGPTAPNVKYDLDVPMTEEKSLVVAYLLWFFLGWFGVHHFYLGKVGRGIAYLLTFAWFTIGWWMDLFTLAAQVKRINFERQAGRK